MKPELTTPPGYHPSLELKDYLHPEQKQWRNATLNFFATALQLKASSPTLPVLWTLSSEHQVIIKDLQELKSILIVGPPCIGKSTFIHQLVFSLLTVKHPSELKLVLMDCKGVELGGYRVLENHFLAKLPGAEEAVVREGKQIIATLNALCTEMDNRFELLNKAGCRNSAEYNQKFLSHRLAPQQGHQYLPAIVLIVDELADLVLWGKTEVYGPLQRLITGGYKVGLLQVLSTNQFIGDTVPSTLLSVVEHRVVFRLSDREDYRRYLDTTRVERALKAGEFLYGELGEVRKGTTLQLDNGELDKLIEHISNQKGYPQAFLLPKFVDEKELDHKEFDSSERDPLFEEAARLIVQNQVGSPSLLQRRMKLGYNRAGRLMDQLERAGIVGANQGSRAREVLIKTDADLFEYLQTLG